MHFGAQPSTADLLTRNVSAPRFETYRAVATDRRHAAQLYRWNLAVSGALHESLAIVEVALRNAMDRELKIWNLSGFNATEEWVKYPAKPLEGILNPKNFSTYSSAFDRASQSLSARSTAHRRYNTPITHDDLVANISFGTWKKLLPRKMPTQQSGIGPGPQRGMWTNSLSKAFPNKPHATAIHYWVSQVHALRNRVAHAEPLLDCDFAAYHRTAGRLLRAIDTEIGQWHSGVSRVPELAAKRP
jgi:hypothetical protein